MGGFVLHGLARSAEAAPSDVQPYALALLALGAALLLTGAFVCCHHDVIG